MQLFPTKELRFKLIDNRDKTMDRLTRRTELSDKLISQQNLNKSFIGQINKNEFKIISSVIGKGAFCVMSGKVKDNEGSVKIEIHKVLRGLLTVMLFFPIIAFIVLFLTNVEEFSLMLIIVCIGQILFIRYLLIEIAFRFLSKESLNMLSDVMDIEFEKN